MRKDSHVKSNHNRTGMVLLIADEIDIFKIIVVLGGSTL
jgi:hypothetical protein